MDKISTDNHNTRLAWFTIIWTSATIVLISLTWRLWTGLSDFPQVPIFSWLIEWPLFADWIALTVLIFSCLVLLVDSAGAAAGRQIASLRNTRKLAACLFASSLLILFLLNQHRLQPWAWQFFLYSLILIMTRVPLENSIVRKHPHPGFDPMLTARWLTASIYFYSAIGKFDYQFIHGLGARLVRTIGSMLSLEGITGLDRLAVAMPVFELLIAVFLILGLGRRARRIRWWGVSMAIVFHLTLIATLSPLGLNHHTGVLVWNFFFMLITCVLFWPAAELKTVSQAKNWNDVPEEIKNTFDKLGLPEQEQKYLAELKSQFESEERQQPTHFSTLLLTIILIAYPALPMCDHWLAWGLYSPNNSRCELAVMKNEDDAPSFQKVDMGAMSLEKLNVPLYPEARFQLGIATALANSAA